MGFPNDTRNRQEVLRAVLAEMLAMIFFVYFGTGSVIASGEFLTVDGITRTNTVGRIMPIAMAFGISIVTLGYGIGNISGAHINPAVTFFLLLIQEISPVRAVLYVLAQLLGAVAGSALIWGSVSEMDTSDEVVGYPPFNLGANTLNKTITDGNGFLFEFMGTLFLCLIVLTTAVKGGGPSDGQPNLAPLVIGFTVFVVHLVLIPFTGCGINPARTFGPAVMNSFAGKNDVWDSWCWIYYVGPFTASVAGAILYWIFNDSGDTSDKPVEMSPSAEVTGKESVDTTVRKYHMPEYAKSTGFHSKTKPKAAVPTRDDGDVIVVTRNNTSPDIGVTSELSSEQRENAIAVLRSSSDTRLRTPSDVEFNRNKGNDVAQFQAELTKLKHENSSKVLV